MTGSVRVGLLGCVMSFLFIASCHDEEVNPPRKPGEDRTNQRLENRVAGDTSVTDSTSRDTTAVAASSDTTVVDVASDTTATDVIPAVTDSVATADAGVVADTTTTQDPAVPGDTTAVDTTPANGDAISEEEPAPTDTSKTTAEIPPVEETPPVINTPPAVEPPAEETPPAGEIPPAIEPQQPTPPAAPPDNLIYQENVEGSSPFSTAHDWDIGSWAYALQFVNSPVYRGMKAARFEIQEDQDLVANGKRAEITIVKGAEGDIGKETWYSFAVYFPSVGYEYDDEREVINQWFQGESPATSLRTQRDRILLESGNTLDSRVKYDIAPITKDTWHTFVIHFIHSYGSDGLIELWYDGVKKLTIRGGNMYDTFLPKWKIGLYKSAFKYGTSDVTRRVIYFDQVRVGDETSTFETMNPGM